MRLIAGVIAACVAVTIVVRLNLTAANNDTSIFGAAWISYRFFTIWTNTAIGLVCGWIALGGRPPHWITAGLAMSIALVAVVYHALLATPHTGLELVIDQMVHSVFPIAYILLWLTLLPKHDLHWRDLLYWMAYPVIYCVYALLRAAVDGVYPYFFLNLENLGVGGVALWVAGLAGVFAAMGLVLIGAVRMGGRRARTA